MQRGSRRRRVFRRKQHFHRHHRAASTAVLADQRLGRAVVGGPGEVVHVALHETMRDQAVFFGRRTDLFAGGAHGIAFRHRQADVVAAEIGVELAVDVILVHVPARRSGAALARQFEHAHLGEPLRDEVEAAHMARARHGARQLVEEGNVDRRAGAGRDRLGQIEANDGAIGGRTAVGLHVTPGDLLAALADRTQFDVAPIAVLDVDAIARTEAGHALFAHVGAAGAFEGIEIGMQVDGTYLAIAAVAPGHALAAVDRVLDRVELGLDDVVDHAVGQRRFRARAFAAPGARRARNVHRRRARRSERNLRIGCRRFGTVLRDRYRRRHGRLGCHLRLRAQTHDQQRGGAAP